MFLRQIKRVFSLFLTDEHCLFFLYLVAISRICKVHKDCKFEFTWKSNIKKLGHTILKIIINRRKILYPCFSMVQKKRGFVPKSIQKIFKATCFDVIFILWEHLEQKTNCFYCNEKKEFKTVYNNFEWLLWTIHLPFLQLSCTIHPSQINLVQIQNKVENIRKNTMPNCKPAQWWWCRRRPNLQIPFKSLSAQNVWNNIIPAQPSQTNCCILFYSD